MSDGKWLATYGSQIEELSVTLERTSPAELYLAMAQNAERIQLEKLYISSTETPEVDYATELAHCITKVTSLQELEVFWPRADFPANILRSFRRNGTLQFVRVIGSTHLFRGPEAAPTTRLVQAYCERNRSVHRLLFSSTSDCEEPEHDLNDDRPRKRRKLSFDLTLLQVAQQIPDTKSSTVLRKLLLCGDSIGFA